MKQKNKIGIIIMGMFAALIIVISLIVITTLQPKPIANKDTVQIDFDGYIDGVKFAGGSSKDVKLTIGSNQFIKGFESQLIGHKVNDNVDIKVKFPSDYYVEKLRNKVAIFKTRIKNVITNK